MSFRFAIQLLGAAVSVSGASGPDGHVHQRPPEVAGVVMDSLGIPIAFASIQGPGVDPRVSDDSGRFRFTMQKAGPLSLQVRRVGFRLFWG